MNVTEFQQWVKDYYEDRGWKKEEGSAFQKGP